MHTKLEAVHAIDSIERRDKEAHEAHKTRNSMAIGCCGGSTTRQDAKKLAPKNDRGAVDGHGEGGAPITTLKATMAEVPDQNKDAQAAHKRRQRAGEREGQRKES